MQQMETAWPPDESLGDDPPVRTRTENGVGYIVIHRPGQRNALSTPTREAIIATLKEWEKDGGVRVVVITGVGKSFAAGADLKEMLERSPEDQRKVITPPHVFDAVAGFPGPVIACINGFALGAGGELMMACDLRVAGSKAKMGQPETNLGLIPGAGGTQRLPRLVGYGRAMRMVLTGEILDAEQALQAGLVEEVVEQERLHESVKELAEELAGRSPVALRAAKLAMHAAWELPLSEGLAKEVDLFMEVFEDPEAKKRIRAFLERKK
jgi:enoyl-CoA hydratase